MTQQNKIVVFNPQDRLYYIAQYVSLTGNCYEIILPGYKSAIDAKNKTV